jgi:hypothetical protein
VTHNIMAILFGAMIAFLIPAMARWWLAPSALALAHHHVPALLPRGHLGHGCRGLSLRLPRSLRSVGVARRKLAVA